jgi:hypothetical protein
MLITAGRLHASCAAVWLLPFQVSSHVMWDPAPMSEGENPRARRWRLCPWCLGVRVRRYAFKKGPIPRAVAMPSHSSHSSRLSTFRAPRWGAPALPFFAVVRGARPRGGWRSSAIARLQGFSSGSPAAVPRRRSPRMMTVGLVVGEERAGSWPPPYPQLQGCSSFVLGRRVHRAGVRLGVGSGPLLPLVIGGEGRSSSMALAAAACLAPWPERLWRCFRCRLLPLGWSATARPPHGCRSRLARAGHVQVLLAPSTALGGRTTRHTPRGRYSCFGTASARTVVRTCRCALGWLPFAGAVLVGRWPLSSVLRGWSP